MHDMTVEGADGAAWPEAGARSPEPRDQRYEADLLGNIQQAMAGLQGFDIMALELIQNADDARATEMRFDVRQDGLHVWNSGSFSSCGLADTTCPMLENDGRLCNFHAISKMGSRSKIGLGSQIGRFGIGFISVYQVTDGPIVRSRDIEMRLEPATGRSPTRRIAPLEGTEFLLPWASGPSPTRAGLRASPTPADVCDRMAEKIRSVLDRGLLFLRNLRRVELTVDGKLAHAVAMERSEGTLSLALEPSGEVQRWRILTADAEALIVERDLRDRFAMLAELDRDTTVGIAIPLSDDPVDGLIYAYLPTEQQTGLPFHVNADFFPRPDRRSIVLSGEQHDRYWNEVLLETAAAAIADDFVELSGALGARRLWAIGGAAHALRDEPAFGVFWTRFAETAATYDCAWTTEESWSPLTGTALPTTGLGDAELEALSAVGIQIMHPDLRTHWSALVTLGAKPLSLNAVVGALERFHASGAAWDDAGRPALWAAIAKVMEIAPKPLALQALLGRLRAVPFLASDRGEAAVAKDLRYLPEGVQREAVLRYMPRLKLADPLILEVASLATFVPLLGFDEFAAHLALAIAAAADPADVIGTTDQDARTLYATLCGFPAVQSSQPGVKALLAVPFLRTGDGFAPPSHALLPGGFTDPIGRLSVVDTGLMDGRMRDFAEHVLEVRVLSFGEYIRRHLGDLLRGGPTREQYRDLLREVGGHWHELAATGGLELLGEAAFVRTRDGAYAKPRDAYFKTAELEGLLGDDPSLWVDEDWLPAASRPILQDLLEQQLAMPRRPDVAHLVARVEHLASYEVSDRTSRAINTVVRYLIDRMRYVSAQERSALERLRTFAWIPATLDGAAITERWFAPGEVHRPFQAAGFLSQGRVADLPAFRRTQVGQALPDFLGLIQMPELPPVGVVVAHLEHCMATGRAVSDVTYQILSTSVGRPGAEAIERLRGRRFIWVPSTSTFIGADHVFWDAPPFRGHWHAASAQMMQRSALYRLLGVQDAPQPRQYALLLRELAAAEDRSAVDLLVHQSCLAQLAEAMDALPTEVEEALEELNGTAFLINQEGHAVEAEDAIWCDAEWLAAPFNGGIDYALVSTPPCARASAARLFRKLKVDRLTSLARLRLAAEPDRTGCEAADSLLQERRDLLLWLTPDATSRRRLAKALTHLRVNLTASLQVQAELAGSDPPTRSAPTSAPAFYDEDGQVLHVAAEAGDPLDWSTAFRALFSHLNLLASEADARHLPITALMIMSAGSRANAEHVLRNADFRPPDDEESASTFGDRLDDVWEEEVAEDHGEEPAGEEENEEGDTSISLKGADVDPDAEAGAAADEEDSDDGGEEAEDEDDAPFTSKGGGRAFGTEGQTRSARQGGRPGDGGARPGSGPGIGRADGSGSAREPNRPAAGGAPDAASGEAHADGGGAAAGAPEQRERQTRRSRLLAYVANSSHPSVEGPSSERERVELAKVDVSAIEAVLKYERNNGREPVEQAHNNPGFDIRSAGPDGAGLRLIEVKGLASEWTERGIRLSSVQFAMAREHPDAFWIYVVEHASDPGLQKVHAIANPFAKVTEYWFDHGWRDVGEETASASDINLQVGARIRHQHWGVGVIAKIEPRGVAQFLTIDFPIDGRKRIPFNSLLTLVL
ncbi:DUF3883 domain-containing protein [Sphingomonas sp.]|jgi:hypothetical protein|uniref:DUF3883 domain-containing protein n=1 Tax=Sphingomonas sp. TaxID=28214 RepID=UPI002610E406|nr:DUF3883 domain-containing protein [Sphingomonas sp.]MDF2605143.1 hypothetical protein [Sphingomonas sp.]